MVAKYRSLQRSFLAFANRGYTRAEEEEDDDVAVTFHQGILSIFHYAWNSKDSIGTFILSTLILSFYPHWHFHSIHIGTFILPTLAHSFYPHWHIHSTHIGTFILPTLALRIFCLWNLRRIVFTLIWIFELWNWINRTQGKGMSRVQFELFLYQLLLIMLRSGLFLIDLS